MRLVSSEFAEGSLMPVRYTCQGDDISPAMTITDVPKGVESLALIMDDTDSPGGVFTHWLCWNISPRANDLFENFSEGIMGINDFHRTGYGGPCPSIGVHHYHFRLYALSRALDLPSGADRRSLEEAMRRHVLAKAEAIGTYYRT